MAEDKDYLDIGFNNFLQQEGNNLDYLLGSAPVSGVSQNNVVSQEGGAGEPEIKDGSSLADLWITNSIKSKDWKPKTTGFYLNGQTGYAEFSDVHVSGEIEATIGTIGGFDIGTDYIRDAANSMGIASTVAAGDDIRFWAGDTFANRATADFRVTEAGAITASNLTATGGTIGGFDIGADYIRDAANSFGLASTVTGGDDVRFWAGNTFANRATAPFRVTETGAVIATDITITSGDLTNSSLNAGSVDTAELVDAAVETAKLNDLAVTTGKIAALGVTTAKIDNLAVTNTKIANATIESAKIVSLNADKINVGTLTGFIIQTAANNYRLKLSSLANFEFLYNDIVYGQAYITSYAGGQSIIIDTNDGDLGGRIGVQNGTVPGTFLHYNESGIWVDSAINMGKNVIPDSTYDLGSSGSRWGTVFSGAGNFSGNITVDGTVDGVDIAAHAHSGAGQGGTVSHASLGSIGASNHHSSTSNGLVITPNTTTSFVYLRALSEPPGTASSYSRLMYWDTTKADIVFSNGTDWYKVSATLYDA